MILTSGGIQNTSGIVIKINNVINFYNNAARILYMAKNTNYNSYVLKANS